MKPIENLSKVELDGFFKEHALRILAHDPGLDISTEGLEPQPGVSCKVLFSELAHPALYPVPKTQEGMEQLVTFFQTHSLTPKTILLAPKDLDIYKASLQNQEQVTLST